MIRTTRLLPALLALALPATAIAAAPDVEASPALVKAAREFGDPTLDLKVEGDTDKAVFLSNEGGQYLLISIEVMPASDNPEADKPRTVAIVRTRSHRVDRPTAGDRTLFEQRGVSVFVIGEWARPAPMWEIGRHGGAIMFRTVDQQGVAGAWQSWP